MVAAVLVLLMGYLYMSCVMGMMETAPIALMLVPALVLVLGVGLGEWWTRR